MPPIGTEIDRSSADFRANAERMQNLVDDLLDLSRIESGGWRPSPIDLDAAHAIGDALTPLREAAARKGTRLVTEVEVPSLRADPMAVRQIVTNLVENAIRHTPSGGTITVYTRSEHGSVQLGVRDTGSGIPAEHLPRVFERFYRVDPARSRDAGGTGLGLAIVKHLVEAHGGTVSADSEPSGGTVVVASFPV